MLVRALSKAQLSRASRTAAGLLLAGGAGGCAISQPRDLNFDDRFLPSSDSHKLQTGSVEPPLSTSEGKGEISTHVICKLGPQSVDGAAVRVSYHPDLAASVHTAGWTAVCERYLSSNGGVDDLVPPGSLHRGLYLLEFDFHGVDQAARQIFRKSATGYVALNPNGFFLAPRCCITLKVCP